MPDPNDTIRPILDQLDADSGRVQTLRNYYGGHQAALQYSTARFREAFGKQLAGLVSNFMRLVVDTISERINLLGFRFGTGDPDQTVWDTVWQANGLDADAALAHTDALVTGRTPLLVWPDAESGAPRVTIEDARWCMVRYRPGNRRIRLDAIKVWSDEQGYGRCSYFTPDTVRLYRTNTTVVRREDVGNPTAELGSLSSNGPWQQIDSTENPFGEVPIVELRPRPHIDGTCSSEIGDLLSLQDAINKIMADAMVASEYSAFLQRWVTGIDVPRDDNGQPVQPFAETARLYVSESPDTKFGQFEQVNLQVFSGFMTTLIEHLSSISGIPGHILLRLSGQYPSGEALQAAESSLVDKARRYCVNFGESYEAIVRMALSLRNDPKALDTSCEAIWADPAHHNPAVLVDSLLKLQSLGVPNDALWALYGATPQQIESWQSKPVPARQGETT